MNKQTKVKQSERRKAHAIAVTAIIVIALLIIFELSPFGGNIRFYAKWIECGQKPVASDISLGLGSNVKNYVEPNSFAPIRFGQPRYFCTPLQAEIAGYSANPNRYEFPHINTQ